MTSRGFWHKVQHESPGPDRCKRKLLRAEEMQIIQEKRDVHLEIKVLMYDRISANEINGNGKSHWSYVSVSQLRRQVELLLTWGFTPITLRDFLWTISGRMRPAEKPVIITFGNAYSGTYRTAFPVLRELGVTAVVFAMGNRTMKTDNWGWTLGLPAERLATDAQLVEMHESGFEIGSHSLTHPNLTRTSDQDTRREISLSKEILESLLAAEVVSFSYPCGAVDARCREMVGNAGYWFGCGIDTGPEQFGADLLNIRRTTITSTTDALSFGRKLLKEDEILRWFGESTYETPIGSAVGTDVRTENDNESRR